MHIVDYLKSRSPFPKSSVRVPCSLLALLSLAALAALLASFLWRTFLNRSSFSDHAACCFTLIALKLQVLTHDVIITLKLEIVNEVHRSTEAKIIGLNLCVDALDLSAKTVNHVVVNQVESENCVCLEVSPEGHHSQLHMAIRFLGEIYAARSHFQGTFTFLNNAFSLAINFTES